METAPRDLVIERFRAVAEQEREEEVANHKHAPVLNDMTLDGFVVVPPVSKSSANTDKCDWLREHLDEDRDVQSFISSESGDSVEQFKKANTSLTFGDIVVRSFSALFFIYYFVVVAAAGRARPCVPLTRKQN